MWFCYGKAYMQSLFEARLSQLLDCFVWISSCNRHLLIEKIKKNTEAATWFLMFSIYLQS